MAKAIILGDAYNSTNTIELYKQNRKTSILEELHKRTTITASAMDSSYNAPIDLSWVKFAAGHYNISPNLKDYIVVRIPALTSDIPNRNMQGFMTKTLFEFDPEYGCQRYKTFMGRPVCKNHNNKNLRDAQGIVVDVSVVPVPKYKVVKVFLLALIDRTKCTIVDSVLRFGGVYSMGALNGVFQCSVCGGVLGPECQRTCTCYHSDFKDVRSYGGIFNGRLHYVSACNPIFGEISILSEAPADYSAVGDFIDMKLK